ncbi:MAG: FlgO family outer membrane protein [Thermodesulfobacteriota bacterium]
MIRKICAAALLLGIIPAVATPAAADDGREAGADREVAAVAPAPARLPVYRSYAYNYPHEIPADYVYRTGRVFSPQNMGSGLLPSLAGGNGMPVASNAALATAVHELAQKLLATSREEIADEYTVAVSTFVNLNNLYATSALGRYVGEQMIGELQNSGVEVVDVRKTPGIMVSKHHGEYAMSRDMKELAYIQNAQAMLAGTYAVAEGRVYLNARLLRNEDNMVLAAATLELPLDAVVAGMLADEAMPVGRPAPVAVRAFGKK